MPSQSLIHVTTLSPSTPNVASDGQTKGIGVPAGPRAWFTASHPTLPLLATCLADRTVRVYSLADLDHAGPATSLHSRIEGGHKRSIRACAWKPNLPAREMVLATASFDATVGIWRHNTHDQDDDGGAREGRGGEVEKRRALDREMDMGGADDDEEEEEQEDWRFAIVLEGHDSEVKSVSWSAGGNFLATCSRDKSVWVWEEVDAATDEYETVAVLQEHQGDVKCVAWHPEEEMLASGSYDDEIRLWKDEGGDDWGCVWVGTAHASTVWMVAWEGVTCRLGRGEKHAQSAWMERRELAGPRLISCSDDRTIKIWRRRPKQRVEQSRFSIIKSADAGEDWVEEATLPAAHSRSIYAVAWSHKTGLVVSGGGDGKIVVYEERWSGTAAAASEQPATDDNDTKSTVATTTWHVVAEIDAAHGVFEVNHVTWAPRRNSHPSEKENGAGDLTAEWIVSTGDDGTVKIWSLPW